MLEPQSVADLRAEAIALARVQLEDGARAATGSRASRPESWPHGKHPEVLVEEQDIDREAHEERVDGGGRAQQDAFSGGKLASPEEPPQAYQRAVCHDAFSAHDRVLSLGDDRDPAVLTAFAFSQEPHRRILRTSGRT